MAGRYTDRDDSRHHTTRHILEQYLRKQSFIPKERWRGESIFCKNSEPFCKNRVVCSFVKQAWIHLRLQLRVHKWVWQWWCDEYWACRTPTQISQDRETCRPFSCRQEFEIHKNTFDVMPTMIRRWLWWWWCGWCTFVPIKLVPELNCFMFVFELYFDHIRSRYLLYSEINYPTPQMPAFRWCICELIRLENAFSQDELLAPGLQFQEMVGEGILPG